MTVYIDVARSISTSNQSPLKSIYMGQPLKNGQSKLLESFHSGIALRKFSMLGNNNYRHLITYYISVKIHKEPGIKSIPCFMLRIHEGKNVHTYALSPESNEILGVINRYLLEWRAGIH